MAGIFKRITIKPKRKLETLPGASPGTLQVSSEALPARIFIYSYQAGVYTESEVSDFQQLIQVLNSDSKLFHWVDIRGLGNLALLKSIQDLFDISSLVLEDILHTHQRPKLEEYNEYCFAISRMISINSKMQLENEQLSFILTKNILFTFHEDYNDCLDPVRKRLKEGKGNIRIGGTSYLMYALMDVVLDNYFSLINRFGDELDLLEERLYRRPDRSITFETQQIKKTFIILRRAIWPERDKLNDMLRSNSDLITPDTKFFLRDAYDHAIQIIDIIENYKDISSGLIELYLSFNSNRMNEIIKVLTIISAVFIPLTFIAGVYGMNFAYQDPETGKILHKNMPELYSENGYPYAMSVMFLVAFFQIVWFWKKGWLK